MGRPNSQERISKMLDWMERQITGERKRYPSEFNPKPPQEKYFGAREPDARFKKETRTFEVQELWPIHHEIVRRLVLGQKAVDIANDLGVSQHMISYVRNSPVVKEKIQLMSGARDADTIDLRKRIDGLLPKALDVLEEVITKGEVDGQPTSVNTRIKESNTMLARGGFGPITNIKGQVAHGHFTKEDIEEIKSRARKDGIESGSVIDVTPREANDEEAVSNTGSGG